MLSIPAMICNKAMTQPRVKHGPTTFKMPLELRNSKKGIDATAEITFATIDRTYVLRTSVIKNTRPITIKAAFNNLLT